MRKKSPTIKVTLDKENTNDLRKAAREGFTTPPRYVNRVMAQHFNRIPSTSK